MNNTADFENKRKKLAVRCEMGDTAAMMELSNLFYSRISSTCRNLAAAYSGGKEQEERFYNYLKEHSDEMKDVFSANMWIARAAFFGHPKAKQLYSENTMYEKFSLIPPDMYLEGKGLSFNCSSEAFRYAGLTGFPENKTVSLSSLENGVYIAAADAGTDGPDETGFGMEELYDFYVYDQFFHLLHCLKGWSRRDLKIQKVSPFAGKSEEADKNRKLYWAINKFKDGAVKYTEQPFGGDDFLIRKGVLTKCLKTGIRHAKIPFGVTKIGDKTFFSCETLESVTIPETVTEIGTGAFQKCTSLKSIVLPGAVNKIGERTFEHCRNLVHAVLPNNIKYLPKRMFLGCTGLKELNIPETVTVIDSNCFLRCGIERMTLPKNLKRLGDGVWEMSQLKEILIPSGVETIGASAFSYCKNLEKAELPDNLTALPNNTFTYCSSLREVKLSPKLTSIGTQCFQDCENLTNLSFNGNNGKNKAMFPETLEQISGQAFKNCKSLSVIHIPKSVKTIFCNAFIGCMPKNGIEVSPDNIVYYSIDGVLFDRKERALILCPEINKKVYKIPTGTRKIGSRAFSGNKHLTEIIIPGSTEEVDTYAFSCAENLKYVKIEEGVKKLGDSVFSKCRNLKEIVLPLSLTEIGKECFNSCSSLKKITIPSGVKILKADLFNHCKSLSEIYISEGVTEIGEIFESNADDVQASLRKIRIPASVAAIKGNVFNNKFGAWKNLTIIGKRGSLAEKIANEENIRFRNDIR